MKESDIVGGLLVCGFATVISLPFANFLLKHSCKHTRYSILREQLHEPDTRIYQGLLNSNKNKFVVQKIAKSVDVEESMYHGGIINTGGPGFNPGFMYEDKTIVNKPVREIVTINRFDGLKIANNNDVSDTLNSNFHYWLNWDHVKTNDHGKYCLKTSSIYSGNGKEYTVAYKPCKEHIEYIGMCDGTISDMENNIDKDDFYSKSIIAINSMPILFIWWKAIKILM